MDCLRSISPSHAEHCVVGKYYKLSLVTDRIYTRHFTLKHGMAAVLTLVFFRSVFAYDASVHAPAVHCTYPAP
jgi:hypothetical protein